VIKALFLTHRVKFDPFPTVRLKIEEKWSRVKVLGTGISPKASVGELRLSPGENAIATTQSTGYMETRAITMRKACLMIDAATFFADLAADEPDFMPHSS
jgi:hypothetical protein